MKLQKTHLSCVKTLMDADGYWSFTCQMRRARAVTCCLPAWYRTGCVARWKHFMLVNRSLPARLLPTADVPWKIPAPDSRTPSGANWRANSF